MAVIRCTERQGQILGLAARGQSDKQIAAALGLSIHTVRSHLQRLYRSEGFSNRAEAVAAWLAASEAGIANGSESLEQHEERVAQAAVEAAANALPVQSLPAPAQAELVNQHRATAGLLPLGWDDALAEVAQASARRMAASGHLDTIIGVIDGPAGRPIEAENTGYWSGINDPQMHALFIANPKQRRNVLGPYERIGAGWAVTQNGVAFLSVLFA